MEALSHYIGIPHWSCALRDRFLFRGFRGVLSAIPCFTSRVELLLSTIPTTFHTTFPITQFYPTSQVFSWYHRVPIMSLFGRYYVAILHDCSSQKPLLRSNHLLLILTNLPRRPLLPKPSHPHSTSPFISACPQALPMLALSS